MSAPSTAYLDNSNFKIQVVEEDTVGTVLATYNHFIPKKLYSTIANTISLFALDGLEEDIAIEDTSGNVIDIGFLGYCTAGSANLELHSADRIGKLAGTIYDSAEVFINNRVYFNDGGLNIKAKVTFISLMSDRANAIRVKTNINVPYYNYDTDLYLACSVYRSGVLISVQEKKITYGIANRGLTFEAILSDVDNNAYEAFDEVIYTIRTDNSEGTFNEGTSRSFVVKPALVTWNTGTWPSTAVSSPTGSSDLRFAKVPFVLGDTFYLNDIMGVTAPAGYYADFEKWYQLNLLGVLIDEGYHGDWPAGDPATPRDYTITTIYGYRASFFNITTGYLSNLIDYDAGTGWDTPFSIYLSTKADFTYLKYCSTSSLSGFVSDGYYVFPYGGGDRSTLLSARYLYFVRIESGAITERWEYDTIDQTSTQVPLL